MRDLKVCEGDILLDEEGHTSTRLALTTLVDEGVALDGIDREGNGKTG